MSVSTALTQLAIIAKATLTDLKAVHEHPPESVNEGPSMILGWLSGEGELATAGSLTDDVLIARIVIMLPRKNLKAASITLRPYIASFRAMIWGNNTLNGSCLAIDSYRFEGPGLVPYNGMPYYGIVFDIGIQFKDTVTFAQ